MCTLPVEACLTSSRVQYQKFGVRTYEVFTKLVKFEFDSCSGIGNFTSMNVAVSEKRLVNPYSANVENRVSS